MTVLYISCEILFELITEQVMANINANFTKMVADQQPGQILDEAVQQELDITTTDTREYFG